MTVDFATYCCKKDVDKLRANFIDHVHSHNYNFDNVHLIYQRITPDKEDWKNYVWDVTVNHNDYIIHHLIKERDYTKILRSYGIKSVNEEADKYTHGWNHSHYWRHHCVNHLVALRESKADYIVLCDADCHIKNQPAGESWVNKGIDILQKKKNILVVSPSDGSATQITQTMSQQIFICERERLAGIDFDLPFTGFKDGGPMAEYYFMLEGRIGRYMEANDLYRHILDARWRYWHLGWH